jgi:endonuclease/exonuclease/phosphatase family metal-dependent hydrolase
MSDQAPDTTAVRFTAVTWNLFHGRDFPPDPALRTWRSRLLRTEERNAAHLQVNHDLEREFATVLAEAEWDVALLQECPPRFTGSLARACGAEAHRVLTSRNSFGSLRARIAHLNPDLIGSNEGGSNLTLVRTSFRCASCGNTPCKAHRQARIVERREVEIHRGRPERRAMALTRVAVGGAELCIANLHASANRPHLAREDVLVAAEAAVAWAGTAPLLFGGDLNLRPGPDQPTFEELRSRCALEGTTGPEAIDHLLSRGMTTVERPAPWPAQRRELDRGGLALRLSDHAPVEATFGVPGDQGSEPPGMR